MYHAIVDYPKGAGGIEVEHSGDNHSNNAGLSRRSFIEVAVGTITAIPIAAGASLAAPARVAFAD